MHKSLNVVNILFCSFNEIKVKIKYRPFNLLIRVSGNDYEKPAFTILTLTS